MSSIGGIPLGAVFIWGAENVGLAVDTRVMPPGYGSGILNTATPRGFVAPRAGVLRNFVVRHNAAIGNGNTVVYTVRVAGVNTAITATLATGAIGQAADAVNQVTVLSGQLIELIRVIAVSIGAAALESLAACEFQGAPLSVSGAF